MISSETRRRIYVGLSAGLLCLTLALTANSQVKTETKVEEGLASQVFKIETAEVVYVSGHDLVVKTENGGFGISRMFQTTKPCWSAARN